MKNITHKLRKFAKSRKWDQFHSPKNLACSICVESSELLELFQWSQGNNWSDLKDKKLRKKVEEELADILLYLLRFADKGGFDLEKAANLKLQLNAEKYPVEKSRGRDTKYTDF
ncbi:MAG: nucleotide pyrophosphohydrolase [Chitinophagia bacterium]|jgi:NTP pyrophosphatase (non-canonical NTP hydrolase)|nr:nucleotide pyrophosphohydrolase [Chitinophagia bacterium]